MQEQAKALVHSPGAWTHPCKEDKVEELVPNIYPKTKSAGRHHTSRAADCFMVAKRHVIKGLIEERQFCKKYRRWTRQQ
eukprot:6614351-Prorocentrum_lima.AAC.1